MSKKKEGTSSKKKAVSSMANRKHAGKNVSKSSKPVVSVAPQENAFVTLDGKRLSTILELAHELDQMADHVFHHHVNESKNDFANWIHDIFHEAELASALTQTKDKHHTHIVVLRHIVNKIPDQSSK